MQKELSDPLLGPTSTIQTKKADLSTSLPLASRSSSASQLDAHQSQPSSPQSFWSKFPVIKCPSLFKLNYGNKWCNPYFWISPALSLGELVLTAISISSINTMYNDFETDHDSYTDFSTTVLIPAIGGKLLSLVNSYLIVRQATQQSDHLAKEIAEVHFSRQSRREEGSDKLAGKLIFDSFDIIRPSLIILHEKVIYKFLEIFVYGISLVVVHECDARDVSIIGGSALGFTILGCLFSINKVKDEHNQYLATYQKLYDDVSTILGTYETVEVLGAKDKIVAVIGEKMTDFAETADRDTHGFSKIVGVGDIILFSAATILAVTLSYRREYRGNEFVYLFGYSILQAKNVKELTESFLKIMQAQYSLLEIEGHKEKSKKQLSVSSNSVQKKDCIRFKKVNFHGKITELSFTAQLGEAKDQVEYEGDKIYITGPSGCGKSLILKLLAGLYKPVNKYDHYLSAGEIFSPEGKKEQKKSEENQEKNKSSISLCRTKETQVIAYIQHNKEKKEDLNLTQIAKQADKMALLAGLEWPDHGQKSVKFKDELLELILTNCKNIPPNLAGTITIEGNKLSSMNNFSERLIYIHEKTEIFPFSLADNISIADSKEPQKIKKEKDSVTLRRIQTAAEEACLQKELELEKDTQEKSKSLLVFPSVEKYSSGQKKRVGLARLFFKGIRTDILLLDEPVANLDPAVEKVFLDNLARVFISYKPKTIFVIEHGKNFRRAFGVVEGKETFVYFNKIIKFGNDGSIKLLTRGKKEESIGYWNNTGVEKEDAGLSKDIWVEPGYVRVNVPKDSDSLFWSITLAILLPYLNSPDDFLPKCQNLFGGAATWALENKEETNLSDEKAQEEIRKLLMGYKCNEISAELFSDPRMKKLIGSFLRGNMIATMATKFGREEQKEIATKAGRKNWSDYTKYIREAQGWPGENDSGNEHLVAEIQALSLLTQMSIIVKGVSYVQSYFPTKNKESDPKKTIYLAHINERTGFERRQKHYQYTLPQKVFDNQNGVLLLAGSDLPTFIPNNTHGMQSKQLPAYLASSEVLEQRHEALTQGGEKILFSEHRIKGDGNCGFTALGCSRKEAVDSLLTYENDEKARPLIINELLQAMRNYEAAEKEERDPTQFMETKICTKFKELYKQLKDHDSFLSYQLEMVRQRLVEKSKKIKNENTDENILGALQAGELKEEVKDFEEKKILQTKQQSDEKLKEILDHKEIFKSYVNSYDVGENKGLWLGTTSMRLIAQHRGVGLKIWGINRRSKNLQLFDSVNSSESSAGAVNILIRKGHYNFLIEETVSSQSEKVQGDSKDGLEKRKKKPEDPQSVSASVTEGLHALSITHTSTLGTPTTTTTQSFSATPS